jgi:hypothetical protein
VRRAAVVVSAISITSTLVLGGVATAAGDKPLTKKQFIKKADKICTAGNTATNELAQQTFGQLGPNERPTAATLATFWAAARVVLKTQVDEIGALNEPKGDTKQVKKLLAAVRAAIAAIDADVQAIVTGSPFAKADKLAQRYGLKVCGAESG